MTIQRQFNEITFSVVGGGRVWVGAIGKASVLHSIIMNRPFASVVGSSTGILGKHNVASAILSRFGSICKR